MSKPMWVHIQFWKANQQSMNFQKAHLGFTRYENSDYSFSQGSQPFCIQKKSCGHQKQMFNSPKGLVRSPLLMHSFCGCLTHSNLICFVIQFSSTQQIEQPRGKPVKGGNSRTGSLDSPTTVTRDRKLRTTQAPPFATQKIRNAHDPVKQPLASQSLRQTKEERHNG